MLESSKDYDFAFLVLNTYGRLLDIYKRMQPGKI